MVLEDCHKYHKFFSIAWIDYKNAFDSLSHHWIEKCLEIYIFPVIGNFLSVIMKQWKTTLIPNSETGTIDVGKININSSIFQSEYW